MIHPSYKELMEVVNKDVQEGEEPVITSRYSIVLATAKRARQIISRQTGNESSSMLSNVAKPLSKAVRELYDGKIRILPEEEKPALESAAAVTDLAETEEIETSADTEESVSPNVDPDLTEELSSDETGETV